MIVLPTAVYKVKNELNFLASMHKKSLNMLRKKKNITTGGTDKDLLSADEDCGI